MQECSLPIPPIDQDFFLSKAEWRRADLKVYERRDDLKADGRRDDLEAGGRRDDPDTLLAMLDATKVSQ